MYTYMCVYIYIYMYPACIAEEVFRNDKYSKFDVVLPQKVRVELIL